MDLQSVNCFVMLNTDVTIECLVDSVPEGVGEIRELGSLNVSNLQVEETTIIIEGVTEDNLGTYACSASNVVDGFMTDASVNINVMEGGKCPPLSMHVCVCVYRNSHNYSGSMRPKGLVPQLRILIWSFNYS